MRASARASWPAAGMTTSYVRTFYLSREDTEFVVGWATMNASCTRPNFPSPWVSCSRAAGCVESTLEATVEVSAEDRLDLVFAVGLIFHLCDDAIQILRAKARGLRTIAAHKVISIRLHKRSV